MNKKTNNSAKQNENENSTNQITEEELIQEADQEIENLEEEKIGELENQLRRALADYQNLEKRVADQKSAWIVSANKDLILRLLPGLDNLLLADKHTEDEGVKIAIRHFLDILEGEGVKKIKTENADFDPNLMEAISTTTGADGKVVEEVKAGYTLNGEVIRAAQVVVGKESN
jgi:molecular chaperone GrpE